MFICAKIHLNHAGGMQGKRAEAAVFCLQTGVPGGMWGGREGGGGATS